MRSRKSIRYLLFTIVVIVILFLALDYNHPLQLPSNSNQFARVVVDRSGEPLRAFADAKGVWRYRVNQGEVSPHYLTALLSYEDRWFYYHPGINPVSMVRAAVQNWKAGKIVSGGSTLTMQVARLLHPHSRDLSGKLQQILRALQLEWHLSKSEILDLYLNHAPFGGTREGVQAASYQYLGKPAINLTRAESALMAVLPQAPSRLRPDRYPQRAELARNKVLDRLSLSGVWTEAQIIEAKKERVAAFTPTTPMLAPLLSRRLIAQHPSQAVIQTSINAGIQVALQELALNYASTMPKGSSTAILVVDETNNQVLAYVGSANFNSKERFGHVDMVRAIRSPGSTLKPFLYGLAIDAGIVHSESLLSDVPREFSTYRPANFSNGFHGPVSLSEALKQSLNIPAVEVLEHLGPIKFSAKLKNAGLNLHLPAGAKPNLSIILGGVGASLEQLVQSYGAFSNSGQVLPLQYLSKQPGSEQSSRYLMSSGAAWIIGQVLNEIPRPDRIISNAIVNGGSKIGWKSGTSYGYRDAWSIGFNGAYRVGIWTGRPDGTALPGQYGSITAAPLMFSTFELLGQSGDSSGNSAPIKPANVEKLEICWPLGTRKTSQTIEDCHQDRKAWVVDGVVPKSLKAISERSDWIANPFQFWINPDTGLLIDSTCNVERREKRQLALWPKILEPWITPQLRRHTAIPATDPTCPHPIKTNVGQLRISGIKNNAVFRSPADSDISPIITARVINANGKRWWFFDGKRVEAKEHANTIALQLEEVGHHQLVIVDETGNLAKVDFNLIQ